MWFYLYELVLGSARNSEGCCRARGLFRLRRPSTRVCAGAVGVLSGCPSSHDLWRTCASGIAAVYAAVWEIHYVGCCRGASRLCRARVAGGCRESYGAAERGVPYESLLVSRSAGDWEEDG